jgi:hypothetical protein
MNDPRGARGVHVHANVLMVVVSCHESLEADQICDPEHRSQSVRFLCSLSVPVTLLPLHRPRVIRFAQLQLT